jgi:hypothetical protein
VGIVKVWFIDSRNQEYEMTIFVDDDDNKIDMRDLGRDF